MKSHLSTILTIFHLVSSPKFHLLLLLTRKVELEIWVKIFLFCGREGTSVRFGLDVAFVVRVYGDQEVVGHPCSQEIRIYG